jgi:hypothetical protein
MTEKSSEASQSKIYYFDRGTFYRKTRLGYSAVPAPRDIVLPKNVQRFILFIVEQKKIILFCGDCYDSIWL